MFAVLFEDAAAMIGLGLAALGLFLAQLTGLSMFDGIASLSIGVLLGLVAIILGFESRSLLLGESVTPGVRESILQAVRKHGEVREVINLQTMHLGPEDILVALEVNLADELSTDEIEAVVDRIEASIRERVPEARRIFVECEGLDGSAQRD